MMVKVVLLGDSIRLYGYGTVVPQMLGEGYSVFQPNDNCRFSKYTLRGLYSWRSELENCDIVHWNNGLWDTVVNRPDAEPFSTPEEYVANMLRIARYLKSKCKVVIFATTTPVKECFPDNDNNRIAEYNALIVPELEKMGIIINDLNSLVSTDINEMICDDNVHLSQKGIKLCGEQVAAFIKNAAARLK